MSLDIAAAIPAKGSSTRVPAKNLARIRGVPLFLWAANNLSRVLPKDRIFVDSDSDEILSMARNAGFNTLKRPETLATNAATGNDLMLWQASQIEAEVLIQHLPPMIFLRRETLLRAVQAIEDGYDSAFGVHEEQVYTWSDEGPLYDVRALPNSFTLPRRYREGMGLYIARTERLVSEGVRICGRHTMVHLDKFEQVDIDTPDELHFACILAEGLPSNDPLVGGLSTVLPSSNIKLVVCDVDGCLTAGGMTYTDTGSETKTFHTRDGIAIDQARKKGIEVAFLSSGFTDGHINARAKRLGVQKVIVTRQPKVDALKNWIAELGLEKSQVAYLGDDVNDMDAMKLCGTTACPSDAHESVKRIVTHVLTTRGGHGVLREFFDKHLQNQ